MYQLFKAIKYLHSGNVIHRDQKVRNIEKHQTHHTLQECSLSASTKKLICRWSVLTLWLKLFPVFALYSQNLPQEVVFDMKTRISYQMFLHLSTACFLCWLCSINLSKHLYQILIVCLKMPHCLFFPQPSNVLLDTDCVVKLCDFGLARSLNQIQEDRVNPALTEYVATRWYRAPEILLGSTRYQLLWASVVNIWNVAACVFFLQNCLFMNNKEM